MDCSSTIDFVTALGRLLRDHGLREAFARNPSAIAAQFNVRPVDRVPFEQLAPEELEMQARVLVRKRFREVVSLLPVTCRELGAGCWKLFQENARGGWPENSSVDALAFCEWLRDAGRGVCAPEYHRVRIAVRGDRFAFHFVRNSTRQFLPSGQILIRHGKRILEYSLRLSW